MNYRIIVFSLIIAHSLSLTAMDGQGLIPSSNAALPADLKDSLNSMQQMFGQIGYLVKKAQDDEVTPALMAEYQACTSRTKEKTRTALIVYRLYLSPENNSDLDTAKRLAQENFEKYKKEKTDLTILSNALYSRFLAHQAHAHVLIKHPESMALCYTITKTKAIVEKVESKLDEERRDQLFLDDLLLSTTINSLNATLEAVKKQAESK